MTFKEMTILEPRLIDLYKQAKRVRAKNRKLNIDVTWSRQFKPRLECLVGWGAAHSDLRTADAYELAYKRIYHALEDCRNCSCL